METNKNMNLNTNEYAQNDIIVFSAALAELLTDANCQMTNIRKNKKAGQEGCVFYFERTTLAEQIVKTYQTRANRNKLP